MNSIFSLIKLIEKRPAMYLGRNSISCLKSFLDGWYLRDPDNVIDAEIMNDFQSWVEKKYDVSGNQSWCDIILFYSQDEGTALTNFFRHFDQWAKESEYSNPQ